MTVMPDIRGIPDMARVWAGKTPEKAALIDTDRVVTYVQLDDRSNRIANTLIAAGIRSGSHIGYLGENSAAFFEIWIGVNKAGCSFTPLNWRCAPAELTAVVQDAEMKLIFAGRDFAELAEQVRRAAETTVQVVPEAELDTWSLHADAADPGIALTGGALLAYTSGTTAAPKGVPISHSAFGRWFSAAAKEPSVNWNSDDIGLMVLPNFHLAGTWVSLSALYSGASLAILPAFEPAAFVAAVATHRPTVTCLVPTAIQLVLDHASAQPGDFASLRRLLSRPEGDPEWAISQSLPKTYSPAGRS
jgi:acyl-CoA synthetase (AMP-forming)/AMP-acid ligase II